MIKLYVHSKFMNEDGIWLWSENTWTIIDLKMLC